jgi:hypothetical protein
MYLVFSAFISRPVPLLVNNKSFCVFLYSMYTLTQYIHIASMNQKLICTIKFQAFLVCLSPPNGLF